MPAKFEALTALAADHTDPGGHLWQMLTTEVAA
jgi:hypothetical protein